ncbi:MAG: hypothetical protein J2P31_20115 [Blastocatellia bacterium]|nr:hypothetical protein [Blastocatellia bacterium]MBO0801130.1 hypothetical protein [Blastocatellia bacterium]
MTKAQDPTAQDRKKNKIDDEEDLLVGRVKKVVKKSRRKLSEEKFERQLQRTIAFLEELRSKLNDSPNSVEKKKTTAERKTKLASPTRKNKPSPPNVKAKTATKSAK